MTYDDLHLYLTACAAEAARLARGVTAERLDDATHCPDWDVRALVNHPACRAGCPVLQDSAEISANRAVSPRV